MPTCEYAWPDAIDETMRRSVAVGLMVVKRAVAERPAIRGLTSIR
jgi:hypothetical protein